MTILQRYIMRQLLRNLLLSLIALTSLFLLFDFFDRIDNMIAERAAVGVIFQYFLLKIPLTVVLMLPVATLIATLFTYGLLSKSAELTAMRAAGIPMRSLAMPLVYCGLAISFFAIVLNETAVPYTSRRVKEIYNIDVRQKDKRGGYSQSNFWWRQQHEFFSVDMFDSSTSSLRGLSVFEVNSIFGVNKRTDAAEARPVDPILGWSMRGVTERQFTAKDTTTVRYDALPLPISQQPQEFYDVKADRNSMSFLQLRRFMKRQQQNGIPVGELRADLYEKLAFPFVSLLSALVALPFALRPARTGSMAQSMLAGLVIGFSYYAVHYFSVSLGRAEIWPPLLAAWMANILMGFVALVLNSGAEAPQ